MIDPKKYDQFKASLALSAPPSPWPEALKAMWFDAKGDWHNAHDIAQDLHNALGSWLHAYLHRKEGDEYNARYWYGRAGRKFPNQSLEEEQREIMTYLLKE